MKNEQLIINYLYANKKQGKYGNLYYEGDFLYSYGQHYLLAYKTRLTFKNKPILLINNIRYSSTTNKHKSLVSRNTQDYILESSIISDMAGELNQNNRLTNKTYTTVKNAIQEKINLYSKLQKRARVKDYTNIFQNLSQQLEILLTIPHNLIDY